ncbi:hypothetical protein L9F63_009218, partial [Diploptera punctata]
QHQEAYQLEVISLYLDHGFLKFVSNGKINNSISILSNVQHHSFKKQLLIQIITSVPLIVLSSYTIIPDLIKNNYIQFHNFTYIHLERLSDE